jgi:hypothetical protein
MSLFLQITGETLISSPEEEAHGRHIGKYLSSLRKLDHIIAPKEGIEA